MRRDEPYRIILVDDHEAFRLGIEVVLSQDTSLEVVGHASNGLCLGQILENTPCDMVILDLAMPEMDGFDILSQLKAHHPKLKCLILSMWVDQPTLRRVLELGIDGFVNKEGAARNIYEAVRSIRSGKKYFSADINEEILSNYDRIFHVGPHQAELTHREREVAALIASGLTNKEVADRLDISINTVQFHRSNLMKKLGLKNIAELVKYSLENQL